MVVMLLACWPASQKFLCRYCTEIELNNLPCRLNLYQDRTRNWRQLTSYWPHHPPSAKWSIKCECWYIIPICLFFLNNITHKLYPKNIVLSVYISTYLIRRTACFVCFNELSSLHAWVLHASRPAHNFCDFPCLNTKPIYPWNTEERSHEQSKRFVTNDGLTQYEQYILWVHWFWSVLVYCGKFKWLCYLIFLAKLFNS